jgi:hypothetical protein
LPEDEVDCPFCREQFKIPTEGLDKLVHNFFIQSLVDARKMSDEALTDVPCEVCLCAVGDGDTAAVPSSTVFCVNCNQKLCDQCSRSHRWMKGGPHKVIPIGNEVEAHLVETRGSYCEKHKDKTVELYCFDCKSNICKTCFAVGHRQHVCQEIAEFKEVCTKQIEADLVPVSLVIGDIKKRAERLRKEGEKFRCEIMAVEMNIREKGEELKRLIDSQVTALMAEVQSVNGETCKELENHKERVDMSLLAVESFSTYCLELKSKGKPCDITRAADDLHTRAIELLKTDVASLSYRAPSITITPVNIEELMSGGQNLIGQLQTAKRTDNDNIETPGDQPITSNAGQGFSSHTRQGANGGQARVPFTTSTKSGLLRRTEGTIEGAGSHAGTSFYPNTPTRPKLDHADSSNPSNTRKSTPTRSYCLHHAESQANPKKTYQIQTFDALLDGRHSIELRNRYGGRLQ